jgi:nicotinamidase-related amidase
MHSVTVRQEIVDRVLQRRGRYHLFDRLDPKRTALIVIDMQTVFCAPGSPAEVPASRGIVEPINGLAAELRELGVPVIWVLHANSRIGDKSGSSTPSSPTRSAKGRSKASPPGSKPSGAGSSPRLPTTRC